MKLKSINIVLVFILLWCCNDSPYTVLKHSDPNLKLENGVLFYNELPFNGTLISYYNPEKLKSEIQYENGKKNGFEKKWFSNENIAEDRSYINGFKTGTHQAFWDNGNPKFEYHFNNKGQFHGLVKEWFQTGIPSMLFNYTNGKENGRQCLWKLDGSIKANYEVVNGERFGLIGLKKCYRVTVNKDEIN